jgi:hypothetical protein
MRAAARRPHKHVFPHSSRVRSAPLLGFFIINPPSCYYLNIVDGSGHPNRGNNYENGGILFDDYG